MPASGVGEPKLQPLVYIELQPPDYIALQPSDQCVVYQWRHRFVSWHECWRKLTKRFKPAGASKLGGRRGSRGMGQWFQRTYWQVSNIGFITVHGLNEGHIAPYTDIEFRLTKYQIYIIMKFWYKLLQLIIEETITLLTKIKHIKQMALKIFHNRTKSRLYNKKAE